MPATGRDGGDRDQQGEDLAQLLDGAEDVAADAADAAGGQPAHGEGGQGGGRGRPQGGRAEQGQGDGQAGQGPGQGAAAGQGEGVAGPEAGLGCGRLEGHGGDGGGAAEGVGGRQGGQGGRRGQGGHRPGPQEQAGRDGQDPEGAEARVLEDADGAVAVLAARERVGGIAEAVFVERPGQCDAGDHGQRRRRQWRQQPAGAEVDGGDGQPDPGAHHREPGDEAGQLLRPPRPGPGRHAGQERHRPEEPAHRARPQSAKVATSVTAAAASRSRGTAARAPLPSPRRMPRSSRGRLPSRSSRAWWPGSAERWPATALARAPWHSSSRGATAAVTTNPSRTSGRRRSRASRAAPARAASSAPPAWRSTASGAAPSPTRRLAAWTAASLRARPVSSTPVPRPVLASAGRPRRMAVTAAAAVVLPMPISPRTSRSVSSPATASRPAWTQAPNRARSRAASRRRSPVGSPTPTSTTSRVAPTCLARTQAVAAPSRRALSMAAVTSGG